MYFNPNDYDLFGFSGQDEAAYQSLQQPQALQPGLLGGVDAQTQAMNLAHGAKAQQAAQDMLAQSQAQTQQAMQGSSALAAQRQNQMQGAETQASQALQQQQAEQQAKQQKILQLGMMIAGGLGGGGSSAASSGAAGAGQGINILNHYSTFFPMA